MVLDSDLGLRPGIREWFSDRFLELNIVDGDFGATSDISVVPDLRVRKGLCSEHEHSMVVAHRALLLEGT